MQREPRPADPTPPATLTTMTGYLVALRIDLVEFGRKLELEPGGWPDAQVAFRLATRVADVTRLEALR